MHISKIILFGFYSRTMPNIASVANNAQEKEEEQSEQNIQEITSSITARCLEYFFFNTGDGIQANFQKQWFLTFFQSSLLWGLLDTDFFKKFACCPDFWEIVIDSKILF